MLGFECEKCGDRVEHPSKITRCDQPLTPTTRAGSRNRWRRGDDGQPIGTATLADGSQVELCSGYMRPLPEERD